MKSELDLFMNPKLSSNILRTEEIAFKPLTSLENQSNIEFGCNSLSDNYLDLSSTNLRLKVQFLKKDGTMFDENDDDQPALINYPLNSIFKQVSISLNGKIISSMDGHHGYRSYIETLLNLSKESQETHLKSTGWTDEMSDLDNIASNEGIVERRTMMKNSKILELYGKLHCDMLNQPLLLLNNVDFRIKLQLNRPEFFIVSNAKDDSSTLKILDATLYMKSCSINPKVLLSHQMMLEKTPAIYSYKRVEIKSFTIAPRGNSISLDNIVLGGLPTSLLFLMIDNDSYNGTRTKNPYNFKHNKIESFSLFVNGVQHPTDPIITDFTNNDICARAYSSLFATCGTLHTSNGNLVTKEKFVSGSFILGFDLTNDSSCTSVCTSMSNQGTVRLEARFGNPLENTITCLVYLQYDASIAIGKDRAVNINY